MKVIWTECSLDGQPAAAAAEPPSGPVCVLGTDATADSVAVRYVRVTAKRHDEVIAVLSARSMTGREVSRALGISPMTAIARLNDLHGWGLVQSRTDGRAVRWSLPERKST